MKNRADMVRAMETIVRNLNNESLINGWLMNGVADGDIDETTTDIDIVKMGYCDDDTFSEIMACFARVMKRATENSKIGEGVFYCDNILSNDSLLLSLL